MGPRWFITIGDLALLAAHFDTADVNNPAASSASPTAKTGEISEYGLSVTPVGLLKHGVVDACKIYGKEYVKGQMWAGLTDTISKHSGQQVLNELANEPKLHGRANPICKNEASTLRQWADEYGVCSRGPEAHPKRPFGKHLHIHIGYVDHMSLPRLDGRGAGRDYCKEWLSMQVVTESYPISTHFRLHRRRQWLCPPRHRA